MHLLPCSKVLSLTALQHPLGTTECWPRASRADVNRALPYTHYCNLLNGLLLHLRHPLVLATPASVFGLYHTILDGAHIRRTQGPE